LDELKKPAHNAIAWPFLLPVDPVAWNIIGYYDVVKHPMDISTVEKRLNAGEYKSTAEFEADVRLIFHNCYIFNTPDNEVYQMGQALEAVFNERWHKKAPPAAEVDVPAPASAPAPAPKKVMSAKGKSHAGLGRPYLLFIREPHNLTFSCVSRETHRAAGRTIEAVKAAIG
jgi:Bromodomain